MFREIEVAGFYTIEKNILVEETTEELLRRKKTH